MTTRERRTKGLDGFPRDERLLITAAMSALNAEALSLAESRPFVNDKRKAREQDLPSHRFPAAVVAMLAADADDARAQWNETWWTQRYDFRDAFRYLAKNKRLHDDDLEWLVPAVENGVVGKPEIKAVRGRVEVTMQKRFASPSAAIAYALLALSSMGERIIVCKECDKVSLDPPHRGPPSQHFCNGTGCRERWHSKQRTVGKHKQGEGR